MEWIILLVGLLIIALLLDRAPTSAQYERRLWIDQLNGLTDAQREQVLTARMELEMEEYKLKQSLRKD